MWQADIQPLEEGRSLRVLLAQGGRRLSHADVLRLWQEDDSFRDYFIGVLAEAPFEAFYWELPPLTAAQLDEPHEFMLVNSRALDGVAPDAHSFEPQFRKCSEEASVTSFANLSGDAHLVVPLPRAAEEVYAHLALFSRGAPLEQQHAFWRTVGAAVAAELSDQPLWVSTAGTGVYWLHVRLDERPKYYSYAAYRAWPHN